MTDPVMEQPKDKQQEETPQLRYVPETYYNCPVCGKEIPTNAVGLYPASTSRFTSPQQPSTVGQLNEVLLRAYYRGVDNKGYSDFELRQDVRAINELRRQDMEYVIGKPQHCPYSHCETQTCKHWEELRAEQRKLMEERLNEPE